MAKQPKNRLEEIAQQLITDAGLAVEIGEYEFVSTATRLIQPMVGKWYLNAGLTPPQTDTIAKWFYRGKPPDWVIAFLVNEQKFFQPEFANIQLLTK